MIPATPWQPALAVRKQIGEQSRQRRSKPKIAAQEVQELL